MIPTIETPIIFCNRAATLMGIGSRIKALRKARQMTQVQLAAVIGIGQGSLSAIETGDTKELLADTFMRIARALQVNPVYLYSGRGPQDMKLMLDQDEAEALVMFRLLNDANRSHWLNIGKSLLDSQPTDQDPPQQLPAAHRNQ